MNHENERFLYCLCNGSPETSPYADEKQILAASFNLLDCQKQAESFLTEECISIRFANDSLEYILELDQQNNTISWYYTIYRIPLEEIDVLDKTKDITLDNLRLQFSSYYYPDQTMYQITVYYEVSYESGELDFWLTDIDWEEVPEEI